MFGLFGKNRERINKIFAWVVGVGVIFSMLAAYFSLLF
jgi:hypothetical protein